jgi:hypothetical protein
MIRTTLYSSVIILTALTLFACGRTYQTQQPAVERSLVEPESTTRTDLTDTRAPYSVDQPIGPRPTPIPTATPYPTPAPTPPPSTRTRTY